MKDRVKHHRRERDRCQQRLKYLNRYGHSVLEFNQVVSKFNYHQRQIRLFG